MNFLSTNPNPYVTNIPVLNNIITSATGSSVDTTALANSLNTNTNTLTINSIGSAGTGTVTFTNNVNLSNAAVYMNGTAVLTSNTWSGQPYAAIKAGSIEQMRVTATGIGIGTTAPAAALDLYGSEIIRGSLYVSSMGATLSTMGYVYVDKTVYANNVVFPSDSSLKTKVIPYISRGLPSPVRFEWIKGGRADIGVLAEDVAALEPTCVERHPNGALHVNYAKLVVLCLAEINDLKSTVKHLTTLTQAAPL
jgi:hypothetical protein